MKDIKEDDHIVCWSCDEVISLNDLRGNDGFCPCCDNEIEMDEENERH